MQTASSKLKFISISENCKFYYIKNFQHEFIAIENFFGYKKYITIQFEAFKIEIQKKFLILKYQNFFIFKVYKNILQNLSTKTFQQLSLNGIGWNVALSIDITHKCQVLDLKLGFSKKLKVLIPKTLLVFVYKKKIFIEGYNSIIVGNLVAKLQSYKPVNSYTGKGFLKKRQFCVLKEIKKT